MCEEEVPGYSSTRWYCTAEIFFQIFRHFDKVGTFLDNCKQADIVGVSMQALETQWNDARSCRALGPSTHRPLKYRRRHGLQKLRRQPSENKAKSISAPNLAKISCGSRRFELEIFFFSLLCTAVLRVLAGLTVSNPPTT
eukprot:COSAG01_NODE_1727_length_9370_cov_10.117736_11_plen_140_part_00